MISLREYTAIVGGINKDVYIGIDRQLSAFREERVMATTWVSFKEIKADVAIEQVRERYGVRLRRIGRELRGPCPLPTHTSRRSRDSFSVSPARNSVLSIAVVHAGAWREG